jgi:hypothetical protein
VTSYQIEVVLSHIFYGIPRGDDGKLFRLEVWYYIHRRHVGIYYRNRRTTSYKRIASQTDEIAGPENQRTRQYQTARGTR